MAYRSPRSNSEMLQILFESNVIVSPHIKRAMQQVDRSYFAPINPYDDNSQPIGSNAIISAPHMHAYALEILQDKLSQGAQVLDVGSGSGYLTACFAIMVGSSGTVIGLEHIDSLAELSKLNIKKWNPDLLGNGQIKIKVNDGRKGCLEYAPYDAIHVGAATNEVPSALIEQLKIGGRMVIPVEKPDGSQSFTQIDKLASGEIETKEVMGVKYIPLTDKDRQLGRTL